MTLVFRKKKICVTGWTGIRLSSDENQLEKYCAEHVIVFWADELVSGQYIGAFIHV